MPLRILLLCFRWCLPRQKQAIPSQPIYLTVPAESWLSPSAQLQHSCSRVLNRYLSPHTVESSRAASGLRGRLQRRSECYVPWLNCWRSRLTLLWAHCNELAANSASGTRTQNEIVLPERAS